MGKVGAREYELKTGEKVVVRSAMAGDAESIIEHARLILAEDSYNVRTLDEFTMTVEKERELIKKHADGAGRLMLVAELNGSMAGLAGFENHSRKRLAHHGVIHMNVRKEHRGKGVGRALLESLIEWAQGNTLIEKVTLEVFETNGAAIAFYEKMGFLEEGRRIKGIKIADGEYIDTIMMYRFVDG